MSAREVAERLGCSVFPCLPRDKRPAVDRWEQRACFDPDRVERFWPSPEHNVGIACGPSGLVVIDLDSTGHGELPKEWQLPGIRNGADVLAQVAEWARQRWPVTFTTTTPLGGSHLYFRAPYGPAIRNSSKRIGPLIDVRGQGGYVLAAGSVLDGRAYPGNLTAAEVVKGGKTYEIAVDIEVAPLPAWLATLARPAPPQRSASSNSRGAYSSPRPGANLGGLARTVRTSQPGQQTDTLVWATFRLRDEIARGRAGDDDAETLVQAALEAGMQPESYVRYQVRHVLEGSR